MEEMKRTQDIAFAIRDRKITTHIGAGGTGRKAAAASYRRQGLQAGLSPGPDAHSAAWPSHDQGLQHLWEATALQVLPTL